METFAARLTRLREQQGWSRRELERQIGVQHGVIVRLEGRAGSWPSVPVAIRLAAVLDVTLDELIVGGDDR